MFGAAKPAASLSSGLLARKGQARPAMRPQGFVGLEPGVSLDDLGWNDMGGEPPAPVAADPVPPVLAQRQALAAEFVTEPQPELPPQAAMPSAPVASISPPVSPARAARIGREVSARKGRAAFTLRLDQERHLKLRLASAVSGRSAQLLVTEALDAFLDAQSELGTLIERLPAGARR